MFWGEVLRRHWKRFPQCLWKFFSPHSMYLKQKSFDFFQIHRNARSQNWEKLRAQHCNGYLPEFKFRLNFAWIPEIPRYQPPQEGQTLTPSQWHTSKQSDTGDESGWTSTSKERWFRVRDCQNFTECLHCATKAQDTSTHLLRARKPRLCMFLAFAIAMMFCLWHQHSCFKS